MKITARGWGCILRRGKEKTAPVKNRFINRINKTQREKTGYLNNCPQKCFICCFFNGNLLNAFMATFASFRSHFSLGQYAFLWSITCLTCTAVIRDFGVPAKVHAGPYGSYDKCEIRLIRARTKNGMKWNLALFNQVINYLILFCGGFSFSFDKITQPLPGFKPLRYLFTKLVFFFYYQ